MDKVTAQIETGSGLRDRARQFIERRSVSNAILGVIIFNAVTLGLSTSDTVMAEVGPAIRAVDDVALTIFVLEIAIKLYAHGLRFFTNAWNIFDFLVVGFGLLPDQGGLSALRGLRVIRSLRLLSVIPQMRAVVQALLDALPGMGAVIVMISIVFYVFGVMATLMYGDTFDTWFGTLGRSLYSLFQIMTLESWSMGIVRPVMDVHPFAWAFFVPFIILTASAYLNLPLTKAIILTAFSVLNLFIGLLVNTMQSAVEAEEQQEFETLRELVRSETDQVDAHVLELKEEILALRREIAALNGRGNG